MLSRILKLLIGPTLSSEVAQKEKLSVLQGMAILSSDVLSSVAYATDELLAVLVVGGYAALAWSIPVSLIIIGLLFALVISYRQLIRAYPFGGGSYTVAKENLGERSGLIAASGLLIDYILTVSVSIAAGLAAVISALPQLAPVRIELGLFFLFVIMIGNLRGVRDVGRIFTIPTILFITSMIMLLVVGFARYATGNIAAAQPIPDLVINNTILFLVIRAFSSGCTALTGIEAMSNGVRIFKSPEVDNARRSMLFVGIILGTVFLGITFLARVYGVVPSVDQTVISQIAHQVLGNGILYYMVQFSTLLILVMAANTSFSGFPRVASMLGRDKYLPNQLSDIGSRLVYSNGIILLTALAGSLFVVFNGSVASLIPLYAVGVFLSFTLAQTGMVRYWFRKKGKNWVWSALVNAIGAVLTSVALVIIATTKFTQGAWIIVLLVPLCLSLFSHVHGHYKKVAEDLSLKEYKVSRLPHKHAIIVPISGVHKAVIEALNYARAISGNIRAIYVACEGDDVTDKIKNEWQKYVSDIPLVILSSPERHVVEKIVEYVDEFQVENKNTLVTVVIPEFVPGGRWGNLLHRRMASALKKALINRSNVPVISVAHHIHK
ncbi:MAG: APC family permease [Candidatus Aenigmatarchaeota archaeon]